MYHVNKKTKYRVSCCQKTVLCIMLPKNGESCCQNSVMYHYTKNKNMYHEARNHSMMYHDTKKQYHVAKKQYHVS